MRLVSLPRTKTTGPLDLWVARAKAKLPAAVLVLCPDGGQDAKALLSDPVWQNFAEDHRLCLAALTATAEPAAAARNAQPPSSLSQAALALQAVDREFGAGMPLLLYGWPQGAGLAESLLAADPKRVTGWCFHAPERLRDVGSATPPGIMVCYKENKPVYDTLLQDFAQGRKAKAPLTWIALPGERPNGSKFPALDTFVRDYFATLFSSRLRLDQWQNIDTKQTVSAMDLASQPGAASYLPHASLMAAWMALHVPGGPEVAQQAVIEREMDTFNPAQPKLHFYLRRPVSAAKLGVKVEGVLAFCTWITDRKELVRRLEDRSDFLVRFAEDHHLALLTWNTAQAWSVAESADQRSHQENYTDDLGFAKLASAWEKGVHALCYEYHLPETDFLLYGMSRGAQWAHRLALRKPGHFLAVHIHINSSYDWPTVGAKNILWLQTTGEWEAGYEAAKRFYARCRDMGYPIIFKAGENLGHSSSSQIDAMGLRFFDYALSVKARRDDLAVNARGFNKESNAPSLFSLSGMAAAPYYADFINQEVYAADQKDMIPEGQRVPLPSKALAQAWGQIVEAPAMLLASNTVGAAASAAVTAKPAAFGKGQTSYFGSSVPPGAQPTVNVAVAAASAGSSEGSGQAQPAAPSDAAPPAKNSSAPPAAQPSADEQYRASVQRALAQYPELAQADSARNATFLGEYRRLKEANSPLLADSSWPEQVARMALEQKEARPGFEQEFRLSVQRAVTLYPALAEADSALNAAFLAEYHRLKDAGDALLADPTWPEQAARTVGERLAKSAPNPKDGPAR